MSSDELPKLMSAYERVGYEVGALVTNKNVAYGSSFDDATSILKILYPNGIKLEQYDDLLSIVRILDKIKRIATRKDAFGENPFMDIAGYAILSIVRDNRKKEQNVREETDSRRSGQARKESRKSTTRNR